MICVDASLAAKWILTEPHSREGRALYRACIQAGEQIVAPSFLPVEVTNILRQRMRRQPPLPLANARARLQRFLAFPIRLTSPAGLYEIALTLADTHNLSAVYDAHYVALAQLLGCNLWTADQRLINSLGGRLGFVKAIGGYREGDPL